MVIQLIPPGHCISSHTDYADGRKVSFIYYLTDDWNISKDGGCLILEDAKNGDYIFGPHFNVLESWSIMDSKGPSHRVSTVSAPIDKPRMAFVGFLE